MSWLDFGIVAKELEGRACGHAHGCGLLEGEIGRFLDELTLWCTRVLGEGTGAPPEHLLPRSKALHLRTDRLNSPGDVGSWNAVLWLAQPGSQAHHVRHARHQDPVTDVDGCGMNPDQHVAVADLWHFDVPCFEDLGRAVSVLNDSLHVLPQLPLRSA